MKLRAKPNLERPIALFPDSSYKGRKEYLVTSCERLKESYEKQNGKIEMAEEITKGNIPKLEQTMLEQIGIKGTEERFVIRELKSSTLSSVSGHFTLEQKNMNTLILTREFVVRLSLDEPAV